MAAAAASELTPTQREIIERRRRFRQQIAARAAALNAPKLVPAVVKPEPKPLPEPLGEFAEGVRKPLWFMIEEVGERKFFMREIQDAVARYFKVSRNDLLSPRRTAYVVRARQVSYYLCKEMTLHSLPDVGRAHGGRDHTSALSGIRKIKRLLATDDKLKADINAVTAALHAEHR